MDLRPLPRGVVIALGAQLIEPADRMARLWYSEMNRHEPSRCPLPHCSGPGSALVVTFTRSAARVWAVMGETTPVRITV